MLAKSICHVVTAPLLPSSTAAVVLMDVPELSQSSIEKSINWRWLSLPACPVAMKFLKAWALEIHT